MVAVHVTGPDGRQGRRFAPFIANRDRTALVPCGIFRGLFGGPTPKEEQESSVSYVDDSDLAFPIEILDETFLRGGLARPEKSSRIK